MCVVLSVCVHQLWCTMSGTASTPAAEGEQTGQTPGEAVSSSSPTTAAQGDNPEFVLLCITDADAIADAIASFDPTNPVCPITRQPLTKLGAFGTFKCTCDDVLTKAGLMNHVCGKPHKVKVLGKHGLHITGARNAPSSSLAKRQKLSHEPLRPRMHPNCQPSSLPSLVCWRLGHVPKAGVSEV